MRIKKLTIHGFKSFVDKVTINLPTGTSGIIGPNGCGKSNIVDAIRWVLGEQNARHLRGRHMEDVIFNGSETRKPLGMADVSLTFLNEQGLGGAMFSNFTEIEVSRRLYRSGESEYYINKVPSRLRDIVDLFTDTGIGTRAYSIIEQGQVGWLINAKPEDRRVIFEEAAGVGKFKHKKEAALRKLEATKENLTRVNDIISEVKRQLNSLNRQAKKAERYKVLKDELKSIELLLSSMELRQLKDALDSTARKLDEVKDQEMALSTLTSGKEALVEGIRVDYLNEENDYKIIREKAFELESLIQKEERESALAKMRLEELRRDEERLCREIEEIKSYRVSAEEEIQKLGAEMNLIDTLIKTETQKLDSGLARLEALTSVLKEKEEIERALSAESLNITARLSDIRHSIQALLKDEENLRVKESKASSEREEIIRALSSKEGPLASLKEDLINSAGKKETIETEFRNIKNRLDALEKEKVFGDTELKILKDEYSRAAARLSTLEEMERTFENLKDGAKAIMLKKGPGVYGLIADVIETNAGYEKAVEAVMGDRLQYIIVESHREGVEAIEYLKSSSAGRGSFIPVKEARALRSPVPVEVGAFNYNGAKELINEIKIKEGYGNVVNCILGDVLVVENLEVALEIWKQNGMYKTIVTLDGEIVDPQGIITGGASKGGEAGILQKRSEIKKINLRTMELEESIAGKEASIKEIEDAVASLKPLLEDAREKLHAADISKVNLESELKIQEEEMGRLTGISTALKSEILESGEKLAQIALKKASLSAERDGLEKERAEKEAGRRALSDEISVIAAEKEELTQTVTEIKVSLAQAKERYESFGKQRAEKEKSIEETSGRMRTKSDEILRGKEETDTKLSQIESLKARLEGLLAQTDAIKKEGVEKTEQMSALNSRIKEIETEIREIKSKSSELQKLKGELSIELKETELGARNIRERILEKYGTDIEAFKPGSMESGEPREPVNIESLEAKKEELREKITSLGEVSLSALEEYNDLERRHQFLLDQQADLNRSVESLHAAITRINRTTREKFRNTFEEINAKFQETFPRFFNGGKAELRLADDGDILEAGIEIAAQPPGKRLQNISLLSGGEKALTATSLIFSIFLIKPSPFCLLDEVDAPLDDANIDRFNMFVRDMSKISQFVLITHNKKTMEMADALYGITMEEPGISKIISVRF